MCHFAKCHFSKCHFSKCHFFKNHIAMCHFAVSFLPCVILPSVIFSAILPSVFSLCVFMLIVMEPRQGKKFYCWDSMGEGGRIINWFDFDGFTALTKIKRTSVRNISGQALRWSEEWRSVKWHSTVLLQQKLQKFCKKILDRLCLCYICKNYNQYNDTQLCCLNQDENNLG